MLLLPFPLRTLIRAAPLLALLAACSDSGSPGGDVLVTGDSSGGTRCEDGTECQSGTCMNGVCVGTESTRPQSACTGNLDCESQLCLAGLCANSDTPGEQCAVDGECPNGTCEGGNCMGDGTAPLLMNCLTGADCQSGNCDRRQCAAPADGGTADGA